MRKRKARKKRQGEDSPQMGQKRRTREPRPTGEEIIIRAVNVGEPIEPGEVAQVSGIRPGAPGRSPIVEVTKIGSGSLHEFPTAPNRPIVGIAFKGVKPRGSKVFTTLPGTLLVSERSTGEEEQIEVALGNPGMAICTTMQELWPPRACRIRPYADIFLSQFAITIAVANAGLLSLRKESALGDSLDRAAELLDDCSRWLLQSSTLRSGGAERAPLDVPSSLATECIELAQLGRRIRMKRRRTSSVISVRKPASKASAKRKTKSKRHEVAKDFSWITVRGQRFIFASDTQRHVIEQLHEAWQRGGDGCGLHESTLGQTLDQNKARRRFRVDDIFRRHPARAVILVRVAKGTWALFLDRPLDTQ